MAHHYDDEPWTPIAGIHKGKVYSKELDEMLEKYGTRTILEKIPLPEIERFLREKKLKKIKE